MSGGGYDWSREFHSFTVQHGLVAAVCVAMMLGASIAGRAWHGTARERRLRLAWGWSVLAWQVIANTVWLLPAHFDLRRSLPLHICDLAGFVSAVAMLTMRHEWRAMLYFWALALSSQGFIQPTLRLGWSTWDFWQFWIGHTMIVGSAVYDVMAGGFRPTWRDFRFAVLVSVVYAAIMVPFDVAFGLNYGYVGPSRPEAPTIIDRLGAWPLRLVPLSAIVMLVMGATWGVWPLAYRLMGRAYPPPRPPRQGAKPAR